MLIASQRTGFVSTEPPKPETERDAPQRVAKLPQQGRHWSADTQRASTDTNVSLLGFEFAPTQSIVNFCSSIANPPSSTRSFPQLPSRIVNARTILDIFWNGPRDHPHCQIMDHRRIKRRCCKQFDDERQYWNSQTANGEDENVVQTDFE